MYRIPILNEWQAKFIYFLLIHITLETNHDWKYTHLFARRFAYHAATDIIYACFYLQGSFRYAAPFYSAEIYRIFLLQKKNTRNKIIWAPWDLLSTFVTSHFIHYNEFWLIIPPRSPPAVIAFGHLFHIIETEGQFK